MPQTTSERHTSPSISVLPPKGGDFLLHGIHFRHRGLVKVNLEGKEEPQVQHRSRRRIHCRQTPEHREILISLQTNQPQCGWTYLWSTRIDYLLKTLTKHSADTACRVPTDRAPVGANRRVRPMKTPTAAFLELPPLRSPLFVERGAVFYACSPTASKM